MTATYLPREHGVVIRCNHEGCSATITTASIRKGANRTYAATQGWGRGRIAATETRLGTKRSDFCPPHLVSDHEEAARIEQVKADAKAAKRAAKLKQLGKAA